MPGFWGKRGTDSALLQKLERDGAYNSAGGRSNADYAKMEDPKNLSVASKQGGGNTLMALRSLQQSEQQLQQLQQQCQQACDEYQLKFEQLSAAKDKLITSLSQQNKTLTECLSVRAPDVQLAALEEARLPLPAANCQAESPSIVEGLDKLTQQVQADRDAVTAARDAVTAANRECEAAKKTKDDLQSKLQEAQLKSNIAAAERRVEAGRRIGGRRA